MMGQHDRSEALFYYFRLEDQVPENHLLRLIDRYVSFSFVRERLRDSYSETGRPSIDPELLLRIQGLGLKSGPLAERIVLQAACLEFHGLPAGGRFDDRSIEPDAGAGGDLG